MLALSRRNALAGALIGVVGITVPVAVAAEGGGGGSPANKAVAAGSTTVRVAPGEAVTLLTATFKTSKTTDLLMSVAMECSILTQLTTNNANLAATAEAGVRAWLEIDGKIVPIQSTSTPPQDGAEPESGAEKDKVTFCDRVYSRTVEDQEDPADGVDQESDYLRTKSAHAFNWVRLNAGSGEHVVRLVADLRTAATESATAEAIVGNRTLIIEPTKMANSAVIGDEGTSNSGK